MLQKDTKIYIAGHRGMVGSAVKRKFEQEGYENLVLRTSSELDLRNQQAVRQFFQKEKPDIVVDAAARVGGILANDEYPWQFLYENLEIQNNIIAASHEHEVDKLVFLGSSCIYPKHADQPMSEDALLTGPLEPTNQWYAIAKIAGVKMVDALRRQYDRDYVSLMPTNLYGPNDNFDLKTSHVLPAMIRKFHEAKENRHSPVPLWGTGSPMREFLHVDDVANAVFFTLNNEMEYDLYNVGTGKDITVKDLALLIQDIVGHEGDINWDTSKPDGTPRKLMDVSRMNKAGWTYNIELKDGIKATYEWFKENLDEIKELKVES
ncbi:GDP-L-fucose synthase [Aliifodinibius sp. S!AR15-10]|uniref:GDP-L-fucose synthase family protein n=1 Tax=Aliifodinibius sp. S!AR15-10 TaxID=2950437 RepID=UPI00285D72BC|nr:GDP-L-fucose synthase [Aliifodinibius sp. S!AR15-10]MDR8393389.1 GDP-L-fucose synthase [Aliifodinibius sp. S!AR15-10]